MATEEWAQVAPVWSYDGDVRLHTGTFPTTCREGKGRKRSLRPVGLAVLAY